MTSLVSVFPTLETLETAALHDVAAVVLQTAQNNARQFNAGNLFFIGDQYMNDESAGGEPVERRTRARLVVGEAVGYLLSQNFFAVSGEVGAGSGLELQVTRLGRTIKTREDFSSYGKASLLPPELLHPKLVAVVRQLFLSGQYDAAVLTAFKQIEIAVREIGPYPRDEPGKPLFGTDLMRVAFRSDGPLAGTLAVESERKALGHLFAGAIGYFKNPQSHREVGIDDANVAASRILFASELLMLVDYHVRLATASAASPVNP